MKPQLIKRSLIENLYKEIKFYLETSKDENEILSLQKQFKSITLKLDGIRKENIKTDPGTLCLLRLRRRPIPCQRRLPAKTRDHHKARPNRNRA